MVPLAARRTFWRSIKKYKDMLKQNYIDLCESACVDVGVCQKLTFGVLKTEAQIQAGQLMSFDDVFDVLSLCRFLVEDVE